MEWSTVIFLGMAMVSLVLLMGIIIMGTRKSSEMKELEKMIGKKARDMDSNSGELWKALKKSEEEKEKIFERLQNIETIVTSEVWETIKAGEDEPEIRLQHDNKEPDDLVDSEKAAMLAKRIR